MREEREKERGGGSRSKTARLLGKEGTVGGEEREGHGVNMISG